MSSNELSHKQQPSEHVPSPTVEIDLTHLSLPDLQDHLSGLLAGKTNEFGVPIGSRYLLHGSAIPGLDALDPNGSYDGAKDRTLTAVFATDQPVVATVRAVAGAHLMEWVHASFFAINCTPGELSESGYIYVLERSDFEQDAEDPAEYVSFGRVQAVQRIKVSGEPVRSIVRTQDEFKTEMVYPADSKTPYLEPDHVRRGDILVALLTLRNMLRQSGRIDYTTTADSEEFSMFQRIPAFLLLYAPLFEEYGTLDPELRSLLTSTISTFETVTAGIYEAWVPMSPYEQLNTFFGKVGRG